MKLIGFFTVLAVALTAFSATVAGAAPDRTATAAARQFEGTVVSVNREARTFRLNDVEGGTVRIKVTRNTRQPSSAGPTTGAFTADRRLLRSRLSADVLVMASHVGRFVPVVDCYRGVATELIGRPAACPKASAISS
ncbi:MAG: hypothetical protein H0T69_15320 [Thermoleophilaceae bacterium]|nr:hypothetical protein [Thermoleophilaceae bacterium]